MNDTSTEAIKELVEKSVTDTPKYRESIGDTSNPDMFSLGYQWADKPHRHVYDLCGQIDTLADALLAVMQEREGKEAVIDGMEDKLAQAYVRAEAAEAKLAEAKEAAHYAHGVTDLALKHRDTAEAKLAEVERDRGIHRGNSERNYNKLTAALAQVETLRGAMEEALELADQACLNTDHALDDLARLGRPELAEMQREYPKNIRKRLAALAATPAPAALAQVETLRGALEPFACKCGPSGCKRGLFPSTDCDKKRAQLALAALAATPAPEGGADADYLRAAIEYAIESMDYDGIEWLRAWNEGEPQAMAELEAYVRKPAPTETN